MKIFFIVFLLFSHFISAQQDWWEKVNGPVGGRIKALFSQGDTLIVSTGDKANLFFSFNQGRSWVESNLKLNRDINGLFLTNNNSAFAAAGAMGILHSSDLNNWYQIFYTGSDFRSFGEDYNHCLYAGTGYQEIFKSIDNGQTWSIEYSAGVGRINNFQLNGDGIMYAGGYKKVHYKVPNENWNSTQNFSEQIFQVFNDDENFIYAFSADVLLKSTNQGLSWLQLDTNRFFQGGNYCYSMIYNNRMIAACGDELGNGWGIALSDDKGLTWRWNNTGLPPRFSGALHLSKSGNNTFVGTNSAGVFKSTNFGDSWFPVNNGLAAAENDNICFDSEGTIYAACWSNGFQKSTDKGNTWEVINNGLTNSYCYSVISDDNDILYGSTGYGVFISADKGASWQLSSNLFMQRLFKDRYNRIYGLVFDGGIFRTSDQGLSWQRIDNNFASLEIQGFAIDSSDNLYAGTNGWRIYKSTDDGESWFSVRDGNIYQQWVENIRISPNGYIYVSTRYAGIFRSTDEGATWENINNGIPWTIGQALGVNKKGDVFFSVSQTTYPESLERFYFSNDNGESWQNYTSNLNELIHTYSMVFDKDDRIYLATDESLWRMSPGNPTVVDENGQHISDFVLYQNYPNPFNPSTIIKYSIAEEGLVNLSIYNLLGQKIAELINERLIPGYYETEFNAASLSSGVYVYKLSAGGKLISKKMMVLK